MRGMFLDGKKFLIAGLANKHSIAAGIAILKTAGGDVCRLNLKEIELNKKTFINNSFVCFRKNFNHEKLKSLLKQF